MRTWVALLGLAAHLGCGDLIEAIDPEQPCLEAGYAISSRTYDCTGSQRTANQRFLAFEREFNCIPRLPDDPLFAERDPTGTEYANLFECAYTLSEQTCEATETLGDDIESWLLLSETCAITIEYADGTPLPGAVVP